MEEKLLQVIKENNYFMPTEVPGKGICAITRLIWTIGILVDINEFGYNGRYCFKSLEDAINSLTAWDGTGHPPGNWMKFKSATEEISNENYSPND